MTDKAKASEHDLREGSKPRCPKCGSNRLNWPLDHGLNITCCDCPSRWFLLSTLDFAQFFPIAAILAENQRLAKRVGDLEFRLADAKDESNAIATNYKQRLEAAEAKLGKMREALKRGHIRYSRDRGEPDPTPAFAYEVAFSMSDWKELLAALAE